MVVLGLRGEYFGENNGGYGIIGVYDIDVSVSIIDFMFLGNINIGNLILILEV